MRVAELIGNKRVALFAVVWAAAQGLMLLLFLVAPGQSSTPVASALVSLLGAPLGPLAAAVARYNQGCCVGFSVALLPWLMPFLAVAGASLVVYRRAQREGVRNVSLLAWALGLFGWMVGGVLSMGHALG